MKVDRQIITKVPRELDLPVSIAVALIAVAVLSPIVAALLIHAR